MAKEFGERRARGPLRVLALLLAVVAVVLATGIGTGSAQAADTAEIATDALNLRTEPSKRADVILTMGQGETVEVISGPTDNNWYEVSYGGTVGWAAGKYLTIGGAGGGSGERWIDVNRSSQEVTLYEGDTPLASYWGAMGYDQTDDGYYATANGTYYVYSFYEPLAWTSYGEAYITDWVAFDPERNNGFHSWSRDENGNVLEGGDGATGGCVALEPSAAAAVYAFAEMGMRVEVHW